MIYYLLLAFVVLLARWDILQNWYFQEKNSNRFGFYKVYFYFCTFGGLKNTYLGISMFYYEFFNCWFYIYLLIIGLNGTYWNKTFIKKIKQLLQRDQ